MNENNAKTVFVGLSGGVDSSVCALRLINQGYNVVGVFIKVWHPDFLECNWEQERLDAMRVASKLDIPFLTCDAEQTYKDDVADYFIGEYKKGRTPNPDVMCNKYVKFGAFMKFAEEKGADLIATGHYAQINKTKHGFELLRGADTGKDQSYFLWTLTQEQLAKVLLPVGDTVKSIIRDEAQARGLITAEKKDSQGICFLGQVDIKEFLSHYIHLEDGDVLDQTGNVIGKHSGAIVYTHGQRQGFTIETDDTKREPHYVIARDTQKNTITVSTHKPVQDIQTKFTLTNLNYIAWTPEVGMHIDVQTRYRQKPSLCEITEYTNTSLTLLYIEEGEQISSGQSCVLYSGNKCCGGGIIS